MMQAVALLLRGLGQIESKNYFEQEYPYDIAGFV